jgi:hypothetical protein
VSEQCETILRCSRICKFPPHLPFSSLVSPPEVFSSKWVFSFLASRSFRPIRLRSWILVSPGCLITLPVTIHRTDQASLSNVLSLFFLSLLFCGSGRRVEIHGCEASRSAGRQTQPCELDRAEQRCGPRPAPPNKCVSGLAVRPTED